MKEEVKEEKMGERKRKSYEKKELGSDWINCYLELARQYC